MQTITDRSASVGLSLCLALLVACGPPPVANPPASVDGVTASVVDKRATLHIARASRQFELAAPLDETVTPGAAPARVDVLGWTARAVIVADSYASASPGMSLCQAGHERFLRIVALGEAQATLVFTTKLESCRENIELAEPLRLSGDARTLNATWLEPHPQIHEATLIVRFDDDGLPIPR